MTDRGYVVYPPRSLFFDSGSFTLWTQAENYAKQNNCGEWEFYETEEFHDYMDRYADFIKTHWHAIDVCANLDVLPFRGTKRPPKGKDSFSLSYKHLKELESRGVTPLPVVHYTADLKWLRRYMEEGYPYIGIGGLVGQYKKNQCKAWVDRCFDTVCQGTGRPLVKLHGFGLTKNEPLLRYPWFSVDSTTWVKNASFGSLIVPRKRRGEFIFTPADLERVGLPTDTWFKDCIPWLIIMSKESEARKIHGAKHYDVLRKGERDIIREWIDKIGVPLGDVEKTVLGLRNTMQIRARGNLHYYKHFVDALPLFDETTWKTAKQEGFGLSLPKKVNMPKKQRDFKVPESDKMILYHSGPNCMRNENGPITVLKEEATVLMSFYDQRKNGEPSIMFGELVEARRGA